MYLIVYNHIEMQNWISQERSIVFELNIETELLYIESFGKRLVSSKGNLLFCFFIEMEYALFSELVRPKYLLTNLLIGN